MCESVCVVCGVVWVGSGVWVVWVGVAVGGGGGWVGGGWGRGEGVGLVTFCCAWCAAVSRERVPTPLFRVGGCSGVSVCLLTRRCPLSSFHSLYAVSSRNVGER